MKRATSNLDNVRRIGFVVPMRKLRETMVSIFDSVEGLSSDMVLAPESVVKQYYDLLVVDEAHRLYRRKHLPGQQLYAKFDSINEQLMGDAFTRSEADLTDRPD